MANQSEVLRLGAGKGGMYAGWLWFCFWLADRKPDQNVYMDAIGQNVLIKTQINIPGENWISDIFSGGSDVSLMISSPVDAFSNAQLTEK